jgi:ATP-dependent helicase/DNAse subunit B
LPFSIRKAFGIPTFLEKDSINSYHFFRILQRAKNIFLLYNGSKGFGFLSEKSRYIRQILFSKIPSHDLQEVTLNQNIKNPVFKELSVHKTNKIIHKLNSLSKHGFSATSLSKYLNNPIEFYYEYILRIPQHIPKTNILNNMERGKLIHKTLEKLYGPYLKKQMKVSYYNKILKKIKSTLLHYFKILYGDKYDLTGENFLIISAYERAIRLLLNKEKKLIKNNNRLVILHIEKKFKVSLDLKNEVFLRGKIDRIDKLNDRVRIIDYKTGNMDPKYLTCKSDFEHFKGDYKFNNQFQLLLYLLALKIEGQEVENFQAGVISLKSPLKDNIQLKNKLSSKNKGDNSLDPYVLDQFQLFLKSVISEIFDKKKSFVSL